MSLWLICFSYTSISDRTITKTKINAHTHKKKKKKKKKCWKKIFCKAVTCFILILFLYLTSPGRPTVLAYSWARPAILVAGKGRGGCFYFFCFFTFISVPLSSLSLSFISSTISSIFFLPFSGRRHKMTHKG